MFTSVSHLKVSYNQLLLYGIHIGHTFSNSLLFSAWLVYSYVKNILIINLYKSIYQWKTGFFGIAAACKTRSPIWFINLHKGFASIVQNASIMCGEMSWTDSWIHGFLSNYITMARVFRKLSKYYFNAYRPKQQWVINNRNEWLLSRKTWPRAIFVSSVYHSYWPVREALYLGSPCFGVVDTNTVCDFVTIPFPGNDESLKCVTFYNDSVANFILAKKFKNIIRWYTKIRSAERILSFKSWLYNKWFSDRYSILKQNLSTKKLVSNSLFYANAQKYLSRGIDFYFSRNYGLDYRSGYVAITDKTEPSISTFGIFFKHSIHKQAWILYKLISLVAIRHYWNSKVIKRFNLKNLLLPNSKKKLFFFMNNFLNYNFKNHFFMRILWKGKFAGSKYWRGRYNYKLLHSKYGFRFLKYLFSIRYAKNIFISKNVFTLNTIYLKTVSSILSPKFQLVIPKYNQLGHRVSLRGCPSNLVYNFCRKIFSFNDKKKELNWKASIKLPLTRKFLQKRRKFLIFKFKHQLMHTTDKNLQYNLKFKLKRLLRKYSYSRRKFIYKLNDYISNSRIRRMFKVDELKKAKLNRFRWKIAYKLQNKKQRILMRKFKCLYLINYLKSKIKKYNYLYLKWYNILNINKLVKKNLSNKLKTIVFNLEKNMILWKYYTRRYNKIIYKYLKLRKVIFKYRNIEKFIELNKLKNFLINNNLLIKNARYNKMSLYIPLKYSMSKLNSNLANSKYFSRKSYSYYKNQHLQYINKYNIINQRKYEHKFNLNSQIQFDLQNKLLILLKEILILNFNNLISNFSIFKKIILSKMLFFINRMILLNQNNLNYSNSIKIKKVLISNVYNWILDIIYPIIKERKFINKSISYFKNISIKKINLWLFLNFLRSSYINLIVPQTNINEYNLSVSKYIFNNYLNIYYINWLYKYRSKNVYLWFITKKNNINKFIVFDKFIYYLIFWSNNKLKFNNMQTQLKFSTKFWKSFISKCNNNFITWS